MLNNSTQGEPWGFWNTLLFTSLLVFVFIVTQSIASVLILIPQMIQNPGIAPGSVNLEQNGLLLSVATLMTGVVVVLFVLLYASIREGISTRNYLALRWPRLKPFLFWFLILALYLGLNDVLYYLLDRPLVNDFARSTYQSAPYKSLYCLALIIGAPLGEEFLVRGFLFRGLLASRLKIGGTLLITSLAWSLSHLQYDAVDMTLIFGGGILLGLARYKTNSLYTTLILHGLWNSYACLQLIYF